MPVLLTHSRDLAFPAAPTCACFGSSLEEILLIVDLAVFGILKGTGRSVTAAAHSQLEREACSKTSTTHLKHSNSPPKKIKLQSSRVLVHSLAQRLTITGAPSTSTERGGGCVRLGLQLPTS